MAINGTLPSNHTNVFIAYLQHCLSQDTVVQQILQDRVDGCFVLETFVETTLNIEGNVGREGNGDKVFQSFEIFYNTHEVGVYKR